MNIHPSSFKDIFLILKWIFFFTFFYIKKLEESKKLSIYIHLGKFLHSDYDFDLCINGGSCPRVLPPTPMTQGLVFLLHYWHLDRLSRWLSVILLSDNVGRSFVVQGIHIYTSLWTEGLQGWNGMWNKCV